MTFLRILGPGSALITPAYLHVILREELLKTCSGMPGLKLGTLQEWLQQQVGVVVPSKHVALCQYKQRTQTILPQPKIYCEVADSLALLNERRSSLDSTYFWNIPQSELSQENEAQKELSVILSQFMDIAAPSKQQRVVLTDIKTKQLDDLHILDVYHTLEEEQLIQVPVAQGAQRCTPLIYEPMPLFFHVVNKHQEIEACVQYIIEYDLGADDVHITLANIIYKPILAQTFQRCQILYTLLQDSHASILPHRFSALFSYYLKPGTENLLRVLDCGVVHMEQLQKLKDYLDVFSCDIEEVFDHLQQIEDEGHILNALELARLQKLEKGAELARQQLVVYLRPLKQPISTGATIQTVASYVREPLRRDDADTKILLDIETMLKEFHLYILKKEDIVFFSYFLDGMTQSSASTGRSGAIICDLRQPPFCRKHLFVLGCTQKDYPAFQTKKGIFDENYHALISVYSSMERRYQFYLKQISAMLYAAPPAYVSYPFSTYEGKGMEVTLEIEDYAQKQYANPKAGSVAYPPYSSYELVSISITLSPEMAQALFTKDKMIRGSISALERYIKCPFSHSPCYGLSLRELMKVGFPDSYAGTLAHYLLETFIGKYGKAHMKVAEEKIEEVLMKEIRIMQGVFPSLEKKLENMAQRILTSMTQTLGLLDDSEQHSILSPYSREKELHYSTPLGDDISLTLEGYTGRIDASDELLCTLDYKSSAKMLSEANAFAASQLQLLIHSIVCSKESYKRVIRSLYVSLKNENIPYTADKLSRRKLVTHLPSSKKEHEEIRHKARRMNGWVMNSDIQALDDNGAYIVSVSQNKEEIIKSCKLYDLGSIERYFTKMYQMIGNRIIDGDTRCLPTEEACMFCSYYEICQSKGIHAEKTQLVEVEDDIYQQQKGCEEDA